MAVTTWLDGVGERAKRKETRPQTFDDPSTLAQVEDLVRLSSARDREMREEPNPRASRTTGLVDSLFRSPEPCSPEGAKALSQAFVVLRNSCAGCRRNQELLQKTNLANMALEFAVNQAPFVSGEDAVLHSGARTGLAAGNPGNLVAPAAAAAVATAVDTAPSASPTDVRAISDSPGRSKMASATLLPPAASEGVGASTALSDVSPAIRAALEFANNYCTGNDENRVRIWESCFPTRFMVLANNLKSDRYLLSLVVALIHNCCVTSRTLGVDSKKVSDDCGAARERLKQLASNRAFCCLLMKVVTPRPTASRASIGRDEPHSAGQAFTTSAGGALPGPQTSRGASADGEGRHGLISPRTDEDPAVEWIYLLFLRFAQEDIVRDVYDSVGIRRRRRRLSVSGEDRPVQESAGDIQHWQDATEAENSASCGLADEHDRRWSQGSAALDGATTVGRVSEGGGNDDSDRSCDDDDFYCPVTPEQLVVLNFTETLAGDELMTGGEHPSPEQRRGSAALVEFMINVLSEMPLDQDWRLRPRSSSADAEAANGLVETARCRMREEARSCILRALATFLAGCDHEARSCTSTFSVEAVASTPAASYGTGRKQVRTTHAATDGQRLVSLSVTLLAACGGNPGSRRLRHENEQGSEGGGMHDENDGGGEGGAPPGRKVELLKVIGNACFRCRESQDFVREAGGLPLVLNHCGIDEANPLLREYAIVAIRNLCEGNAANQDAIAALQPQGCASGAEEVLADMGLECHVDSQGKFRVGPRPPGR